MQEPGALHLNKLQLTLSVSTQLQYPVSLLYTHHHNRMYSAKFGGRAGRSKKSAPKASTKKVKSFHASNCVHCQRKSE
jgi:hypothetical protein